MRQAGLFGLLDHLKNNLKGLFIRTIGIERTKAKIALANYNMHRPVFHE